MPVATVWTFLLTCSLAADTTPAWVLVSSAFALICWLTALSSSEAAATACEFSTIPPIASRIPDTAWLSAVAIFPTSSCDPTSSRSVSDPAATRSST